MDGEVVHALLGLLDQGVAEDFPGQVLGLAVHLFQRLVDGHGADRHRAVAQDPFAGFVDVLAGRQIHDGIGAPADAPDHFLDFFVDRRGERGIADVAVDLHQEVAADDHRLQFGMVDVGGNDGAAAGHFVAHEFGRDDGGNRGAETVAGMLAGEEFRQIVAALVFADGDKFHFRRDDALARVVHLGHVHAGFGLARLALEIEAQLGQCGIVQALPAEFRSRPGQRLGVAALFDPGAAHRRQPGADVDFHRRIGIGAGSVVDENRRVLFRAHIRRRIGLADLAHRHADIGA